MLAAKAIWSLVASPLLVTACLFDPGSMLPQLKRDALKAVSTRIEPATLEGLDLRVTGNPWGCGLLVYNHSNVESEKVLMWLHCPELAWSAPEKPKREETFAFDGHAAALTPSLPLLDKATDEMTRALGMSLVSREDMRRTVIVAIQQGISVHEARSRIARRP